MNAFLSIYTLIENYIKRKAFYYFIKFPMHSLHAKDTDENSKKPVSYSQADIICNYIFLKLIKYLLFRQPLEVFISTYYHQPKSMIPCLLCFVMFKNFAYNLNSH